MNKRQGLVPRNAGIMTAPACRFKAEGLLRESGPWKLPAAGGNRTMISRTACGDKKATRAGQRAGPNFLHKPAGEL